MCDVNSGVQPQVSELGDAAKDSKPLATSVAVRGPHIKLFFMFF
jgi:hypothetical protein